MQDAGEGPVARITVYVDANLNGKVDDGEVSTTSNAAGHYSLMTDADHAILAAVRSAGWVVSSIYSDLTPNVRDFPLGPAPVVKGTVFEDADADYFTEGGLTPRAGVRLFLDRNQNGVPDDGEETALSDADGNYEFDDLPSRAIVCAVPVDGWSQENPISSDAVYTYRSKTITGTIFKDLNRNGVRDEGEGGFSNVVITGTHEKVFGDGSRVVVVPPDPYITYPKGVSDDTDADGNFVLHDVPIISNQIVVSLYDWYLTTPSNDASNPVEIGLAHPSNLTSDPTGTLRGVVYNDLNHNGIMDAGEPPMAGVHVGVSDLADQFGVAGGTTDSNGAYEFTNMSRGRYRVSASSQNDLLIDGGSKDFSLFEGETETINLAASFYSRVTGKILVMGESAELTLARAYPVWSYLDRNDNGVRDEDEPRMIGTVGWDYQITTTTEGNYTVRLEKIPDDLQLVSDLPSGTAVLGYAYEHDPIYLAYKTQATVFFDKNRNGKRDRREPLLQNVRVVVDRNDNGIAESSERKYRTNSAGRFNTFMPYGRTRVKVMIPARYRKLGLFSHQWNVNVLSSADAAGLLIGLPARKR